MNLLKADNRRCILAMAIRMALPLMTIRCPSTTGTQNKLSVTRMARETHRICWKLKLDVL